MNVSKNTTNKTYLLGDTDKDGVKNIDDQYPYDPKRNQPVNKEVSLAETIIYVQEKRKKAQRIAEALKKRIPGSTSRIKDPYSIIDKAVKRMPFLTNDLIGLRIETDKRNQAKALWNKYKKTMRVKNKRIFEERTGAEDKYKANKGTTKLYRAYHINTLIGGLGTEIQFRTATYGTMNDQMHKDYKNKKSLNKYRKKRTQLIKRGY